ncbi:acyl-CoA dehydrogenase [Nocardioides aromaticivorans]|uniref:Acyl-CoA dehydrogenase n=1 Tax=Nocardioides aromaticivorans TaxID=200618 RepID=A0ABX7PG77_9ACTN|nr:acyl-CoA dehydrogenase family protein [Nocardioides aromaticivorans]QSR24853.1 acyl-CoA dehydrogenase [Nocardioides aromaticivorans]
MDFSFTQEQDDLRDAVRSFLRKRAGEDARRALLTDGYSFDRELWRCMAQELGLPTLAITEERGGSGAGFLETAILFEELGRDLYAGPFFSTVVATWVVETATGATADALLAEVADGAVVLTAAITDDAGTWSQPGTATRAVETPDGHRLSGTKTRVTDAAIADALVVWAQLPDGPGWFLVRADARGVSITAEESLDLTRPVGTVHLADVPATLLVAPDRAAAVLATVGTRAGAALAAEMVGGAQAALEQSVAWSKSRQQFGRPIGSFQALKHLCADALVEIEAARVLTHYAAWAVGADRPDAPLLASMAKQAASDAYAQAAGNNIQIHGGIGFTWEHEAHLWFRKAKASGALFGTAREHRSRIADLLAI